MTSYISVQGRPKRLKASKMDPMVSVVYLTKNGGKLFQDSLDSVFSQETDFTFDVIVVDSGSTDGTLELLQGYDVKLYHVKPSEFSFGLTRDYGFSLTNSEIVLAISQDAVPVGVEWLHDLVYPFEDKSVAVVQSMDILPEWSDVDLFYWEKVRKFYYTRDCIKWMEANDNIGISFTSCAIRRDVWEKNQLGKVEMSEDKVFQKKISNQGYKIFFQEKAKNAHTHSYNVVSLAKRCQNEGLGWRNVDNIYTLSDMIADILNKEIWRFLRKGITNSEIKRLSELLFPFIRPLFIYIGNRFTNTYVK
jgi:rhamnosyltransferase